MLLGSWSYQISMVLCSVQSGNTMYNFCKLIQYKYMKPDFGENTTIISVFVSLFEE